MFGFARRDEWLEGNTLLPAARRVPVPAAPRRIAKRLALSMIAALCFAALAPWRQSLPGEGSVIALTPDQRPQPIQAPISGRITRWHVAEGQAVVAGELLAELSDNDPNRLERLEAQRVAAQARLEAYLSREQAYIERVEAVRRSQTAQISAAEAELQVAREAVSARRESLAGAEARVSTATLQADRVVALSEGGLASDRDRELADLGAITARADVSSRNAELRGAESNLESKRASLARVRASTEADVRAAMASLESARTEVASARQSLLSAETALAQQQAQSVHAPRAGMVQRVELQQGAQVSQGTTLAYLVPASEVRSVALYVDGNDAALITPGRHVRLQFEGWPAVQFTGWPSVAVGSFGGEVAFVDAVDDGAGDFRVMIVPAEGEEWPETQFLRQGTRAKGWVLLEEVSVGFELWRQLNGFPPSLRTSPGTS